MDNVLKIGLILPTVYASKTVYPKRIFAPRDLLTNLSNELIARGHDVTVFSTPDFETHAKLVSAPLDYTHKKRYYYKFRNLSEQEKTIQTEEVFKRIFEIDVLSKAFAAAKNGQVEILHSYHDSTFFSAHYLQNAFNVPVIYSLHDPFPPVGSIEYEELYKFKSHSYIALSHNMLENSHPLHFVATISHGVKLEQYELSLHPNADLLFSGRCVLEKGIIDAIDVSKKTKKFLMIASSSQFHKDDFYKTQVHPKIDNSQVIETSYQSVNEKSKYYGNGKALLFPIHWEEPFGLVMIEAMACGTPVIAYARGSVPEIVEDGVTGFIVNPSDDDVRGEWIIKKTGIEGLCEAVERIYSMSEDKYREMRINCRKRVEERFTIGKMVEQYEKVYQDVLNIH